MKKAANKSPRYVIPDFFENPIIRPYLSNVRNWQGYIRFLGLPDRRENPDILIDRLFVEPLLTHQYVSPDEDPTDWSREATTVLDALEECKALVILGDPGIGKSTLLNHVAWLLSRPVDNPLIERLGWALPLPMVLRELPIRGVTDFDGLLFAFLAHTMSAPLNHDGGEYLKQSLADGKTFLLLDGIDEVGDQEAREDLRKAVLDGLNRYPHCRWLLSSRIVGYDEVPFDMSGRDVESSSQLEQERSREPRRTDRRLKEKRIATRYVAPFDDRRIVAFAHNWYSQRDAASTRASENANHLVQAIHADESICRLARVPNLLTMMALIHRIEATLPHGRALLYERITEAYLESIDKFRGIDPRPHDLPRKKGWLARIGLEMQQRRMPGDDTGRDEILVGLDTVQDWLSEEMERGDTYQESPSAHEFLQIVARRSGLFLPRGEDRYAFVHLSFQEYFAAVALVREVTRIKWAKNGTSRLGFNRDTLIEWAGKSVWRETFSFVFELLTSQDEDDWHADLLKCVFGDNFKKLNVSSPPKRHHERYLNLGRLLARLVVNSRSGLSYQRRNKAIATCVRILYGIQPKTFLFSEPNGEASWNILKDLLGNDPEIDAKVFSEIGSQMKRVGTPALGLSGTRVSDLAPLANLTALERLNLDDTQVSDLAPLANLTALEWLNLSGTQVSDLAPLANLTVLKWLNLSGTQVSDLAPLTNLTALERLDLRGTQVSDLAPLANLTALESLSLYNVQVSDLAPLANLTALKWLSLDSTQDSDLAPLANLTALESLNLYNVQVSDNVQVLDLAPLANLTALKWLSLYSAQVSDLAPLANLTALERLDLYSAQVSDIAPLANLTALEWLNLYSAQVSDIAPLANLTALESLNLSGTQVSDLAPLANLTALKRLDLRGTQVSDLAPLTNLTALEWLSLDGTQISDLAPLANLTALEWLNLSGTQVSDLAPLANLTALERLDLRGTQVSFNSVGTLRKLLPNLRILV